MMFQSAVLLMILTSVTAINETSINNTSTMVNTQIINNQTLPDLKLLGISVQQNKDVLIMKNYAQIGLLFNFQPIFDQIHKVYTSLDIILNQTNTFVKSQTYTFLPTDVFFNLTVAQKTLYCKGLIPPQIQITQTNLERSCKLFQMNFYLITLKMENEASHIQFTKRNQLMERTLKNIQQAYQSEDSPFKRETSNQSSSVFSGQLRFLAPFYSNIIHLATRSQIAQITGTLDHLGAVDRELALTANNTVAVLISHQQQIQSLAKEVVDLQNIAKRTLHELKKEFGSKTTSAIMQGTFKLTFHLNTLLKITTIQNDLTTETQRLSTSIRSAKQGTLIPEIITPETLFSVITQFKQHFTPIYSYLWNLQRLENMPTLYHKASTQFIQMTNENQYMFVINIPLIKTEFIAKHTTIFNLPFFATNSNLQMRVQLPSTENHITNILQQNSKLYFITPKSLEITNYDTLSILKTKSLNLVPKSQIPCITAILQNNTAQLLQQCKIQIDNTSIEMHLTSNNELMYFIQQDSLVNTSCLTSIKTNSPINSTYQLSHSGSLHIPKTCIIHTEEKSYFPDPDIITKQILTWTSNIINIKVPYPTKNLQLLQDIMEYSAGLTRATLQTIYDDISMNTEIEQSIHGNRTYALMRILTKQIAVVEEKNAMTEFFVKLLHNPWNLSLSMIMILITCILLFLACIAHRLGFFKACCCCCCNLFKDKTKVYYNAIDETLDMGVKYKFAQEFIATKFKQITADLPEDYSPQIQQ